MPIHLICPACSREGKVSDGAAGLLIKCPGCNKKFKAPGEASKTGEVVMTLEIAEPLPFGKVIDDPPAAKPVIAKHAPAPQAVPNQEPATKHVLGCPKCGGAVTRVIDQRHGPSMALLVVCIIGTGLTCFLALVPAILLLALFAKKTLRCAKCGEYFDTGVTG